MQGSTGRKANVELVQIFFPSSPDFKQLHIMYIRTLQTIEKGKGLVVDYGSWYHFGSVRRHGSILGYGELIKKKKFTFIPCYYRVRCVDSIYRSDVRVVEKELERFTRSEVVTSKHEWSCKL